MGTGWETDTPEGAPLVFRIDFGREELRLGSMARRGGGEPPVNKPHELAAPAEPGRGRMRVRRILLSVCLCVLALLIMIKVAPPKEGEFDVHILFRRNHSK